MVDRSVMLIFALCLVLLLIPSLAQASPPSYDQTVDQLVSQGYPQSIQTYLNSLGTSPLGMRWAGSASDNAAAKYLACEMRAMGLTHVRLERVPLDVFEPRGASVAVGGTAMVASQFAGVPGTHRRASRRRSSTSAAAPRPTTPARTSRARSC